MNHFHPWAASLKVIQNQTSSIITQNVVYIPFGEVFVEERNDNWNIPYLFNAKELDEETGLYYYGARYLDPTSAQWLSVDPLFEKYAGMSPYNYCAGNPVILVDPDGLQRSWSTTLWGGVRMFVGGIEISAINKGVSSIKNTPSPSSTVSLVSKYNQLKKASDYGIDTYKALKAKVGKGSGLEVHHLIEKRFATKLGMKENEMLSIVLTKEEHRVFTNAWNKLIGHANSRNNVRTDNATREQIYSAAKVIYKDYPEILKALHLE